MRHSTIAFVVALAVVASGAVPSARAAAADAPAGRAFYAPPAPLPAGKPGSVIWSRPLSGAAALPHAARNVLVLYHTTAVGGNDVAVSGTVAIPPGTPPAGGWPVISWAHGTTGDGPQCTPSLDERSGPEHWYLGPVDELLDGYVARGYAVVQTDYEGQGTPGVHPYLVGVAEGRDVVDMVRAARALEPSLGSRYVVMGHSQGGHSALFAGSLGPAWAPELTLLGSVALAPASHLELWLRGLTRQAQPNPGFGFAGLLIRGYGAVDPAVRPERLLADATAPFQAQLANGCVVDLVRGDSWAGLAPATAFRAGADFAPLFRSAAANDPAALPYAGPVLLLQGSADQTVAPAATDLLDRELCAAHANVTYRPVAGASHNGLLPASPDTVRPWIDARFAGTAAAPNCAEALKAAP